MRRVMKRQKGLEKKNKRGGKGRNDATEKDESSASKKSEQTSLTHSLDASFGQQGEKGALIGTEQVRRFWEDASGAKDDLSNKEELARTQ